MFELIVSAPSLFAFSLSSYLGGTLDIEWELWIALVAAVEGIVIAVPVWLLITAPRMEKHERRGQDGGQRKGEQRR